MSIGIIGTIKGASLITKIIAGFATVAVVGGTTAGVIILARPAKDPEPQPARTEENNPLAIPSPEPTDPTPEPEPAAPDPTPAPAKPKPATPAKPKYNLNNGLYLGVKKFGGKITYGEGYYPKDCSIAYDAGPGMVVRHSDGRDCSKEFWKLVDKGVVVLNNLCAVEKSVNDFVAAERAKAVAASYHFVAAGLGANPGCDDPGRIDSEKITEATCQKYNLSCGRW